MALKDKYKREKEVETKKMLNINDIELVEHVLMVSNSRPAGGCVTNMICFTFDDDAAAAVAFLFAL